MFLCYGIALLWCVPNIETKRTAVRLLALTFLMGGLGRLILLAMTSRLPQPHDESFDASPR